MKYSINLGPSVKTVKVMFNLRRERTRIFLPPTFDFRYTQNQESVDPCPDINVILETVTKITVKHKCKKIIHVSVLIVKDVLSLMCICMESSLLNVTT